MNEQHEPYFSIPEAAETLDLTPSQVRRLIEDRYLSAKRINNVLMIPQSFIREGEPVPGVRGTLMLLEDLGFSNDEAIEWILDDNEDLGETPIASLIKGHKAPVRRAVQMLA